MIRNRHVPLRYKKGPKLPPWKIEQMFRRPWVRHGCPFKSWALYKRYRWSLAHRALIKAHKDREG